MGVPTTYNVTQTITKSNTVNIEQFVARQRLTDAIYVGGAGVVAVVLQNDVVQNFTAVAGATLLVAAKRVNSTNTDATLMVALFAD